MNDSKICSDCGKEFSSLTKLKSHIGTKACEKNQRDMLSDKFLNIDNNQYICNKCDKHFKTIGQFRNHYWTKHHNMEINGWEPQGFMSDNFQAYMKSTKYKIEQSERMRDMVRNNPDSYSANNVCGRVKIIEFNGDKFHGTWEVIVAKYLVEHDINYIRDTEPFEYEWKGRKHLYFPDFYIPDLNIFIEVKGYERERDKAKWDVVNNLIVLKEREIKMILNDTFVLMVDNAGLEPATSRL